MNEHATSSSLCESTSSADEMVPMKQKHPLNSDSAISEQAAAEECYKDLSITDNEKPKTMASEEHPSSRRFSWELEYQTSMDGQAEKLDVLKTPDVASTVPEDQGPAADMPGSEAHYRSLAFPYPSRTSAPMASGSNAYTYPQRAQPASRIVILTNSESPPEQDAEGGAGRKYIRLDDPRGAEALRKFRENAQGAEILDRSRPTAPVLPGGGKRYANTRASTSIHTQTERSKVYLSDSMIEELKSVSNEGPESSEVLDESRSTAPILPTNKSSHPKTSISESSSTGTVHSNSYLALFSKFYQDEDGESTDDEGQLKALNAIKYTLGGGSERLDPARSRQPVLPGHDVPLYKLQQISDASASGKVYAPVKKQSWMQKMFNKR